MPKGTEDRRVGRALPTPVTPASNVCFRITIPDAVPYRAALVGSLAELTQWYAWDHPRGVNDCPECEEAAQLWSAALAGATYTLECEETLSCEEIINCIETNVDTRQAVVDALLDSPDMLNYITNVINNAGGLVPNQNNQNLLKPETCDYGAIFAQASAVIQLLHDLAEDIFEAVEVGTNAVERAEFLINIIGVGSRAMVVDTILEWADTLVENVQEEYAGAYDAALYDELRCGLFCQVNDSCVMTIDDVHRFYSDKFGQTLPSNLWDALNAIANFQITGDFPGDAVIYSMHLLIINLIKAGEDVLGINFSRLGLRVIAAASSPDSSWETLCEDCTEIPSIRLETISGFPDSMIEFVSNLDEDTSIYRLKRVYTGNYLTGAYRSVGNIPFYILDTEAITGTLWETLTTGVGIRFADQAWKLSEIPCYLPGTQLTFDGVSDTINGDIGEFIISRVSCPIWGPLATFPTWGEITEATEVKLVVQATDIGGGNWRVAFHTVGGIVFHVDTIVIDGTVGFGSYYNASNVEMSGTGVAGLDIQGMYMSLTGPGTVTLTGSIVS